MININIPVAIVNGVKGGTGKTNTTLNLAKRFSENHKVGILDADVDSPNLPEIMGLDSIMELDDERRYIPIESEDGIKVFSMASFVNDDVVAFANVGSQSGEIIRDALENTVWDGVDILFVDLPAGSADPFREVMKRCRKMLGMFIVTLPSTHSDFRRTIRLGEMFRIPILGVFENMSSFVCSCGIESSLFANGESLIEKICDEYGFKYFGGIPFWRDVRGGNYFIPDDISDSFKKAVELIDIGD